jgi:hypothetical protein
MTKRRLIAMIRGRVTAADELTLTSLATRPQIVSALSRATLVVGATGVACALFAGVGGGLLTSAADAAVAGGGGYGASPAPHVSTTHRASGASRPIDLGPMVGRRRVAPEPVVEQSSTAAATLQGIVAPAPVAPAAPAAVGAVPQGTVESVIAEVFGEHAHEALGVAWCESRWHPTSISRNGANWGLFQINAVHRGRVARMGFQWEDLLDPRVNALVAKSIFDEQGWAPWACRGAAR